MKISFQIVCTEIYKNINLFTKMENKNWIGRKGKVSLHCSSEPIGVSETKSC